MAPEISGGPATRRAASSRWVPSAHGAATRFSTDEAGWLDRPLLNVVANVPHGLAAIIDRCLALDPALRLESSDLCSTAWRADARPGRCWSRSGANPYRGLRAFEAEHRFGLLRTRSRDARSSNGGSDKVVVVAGDSGVGKSSLCRAGVLPLVTSGGFGLRRAWVTVQSVPGRRPLLSLYVRALAPILHQADAGGVGLQQAGCSGEAFQRLKQGRGHRSSSIFPGSNRGALPLASEQKPILIGKPSLHSHRYVAAVLVAIRGDFVASSQRCRASATGCRIHARSLLRPLSTGLCVRSSSVRFLGLHRFSPSRPNRWSTSW